MRKKLFYLLLFLLLMPIGVFAKDDPGLVEKLDEVLGGQHKLTITDYKVLQNKYLLGYPNEEDEAGDPDGFSVFMNAYVNDLPEVKAFLEEYKDEHPSIDVYCRSYTNCGISIGYDNDNRGTCTEDTYEQLVAEGYEYPGCYYTHYDVEVEVLDNPDMNKYNELRGKFTLVSVDNPSIYKDVYLQDLSFVNQLYIKNTGLASFLSFDGPRSAALVAKNFPEINDFLLENPTYEIKYSGISAMGCENYENNGFEQWCSVDFTLYDNKIAYTNAIYILHTVPVIFVSEDVEDDKLIEAAVTRIKNYLNNDDINVVMDDITPTFSEDVLNNKIDQLNIYLQFGIGMDPIEYQPRVYSLKIGNTDSPYDVFIIRTSAENLKDLEIQSIEKTTGIRFSSNDAIPMDSQLKIEDVTAQFKELNDAVVEAFDISIYSDSQGAFITSVANGVKIYIPVENNFEAAGKIIAYLGEDGEILEKYDIEIETLNGQKYLTFVTKHLSVYGLLDTTVEAAENPKTLDNVPTYFVIIAVNALVLGTAFGLKKRLVK